MTATTPNPAEVTALLALSDERDLWMQQMVDAQRAAYRAGYTDGQLDAQRGADRAWAARPPLIVRDGLTREEIEARRWELRGDHRTRESFGHSHPADFPGRSQEAAA